MIFVQIFTLVKFTILYEKDMIKIVHLCAKHYSFYNPESKALCIQSDK
jgi:hypothetical protein